jgi:hypothetical protein
VVLLDSTKLSNRAAGGNHFDIADVTNKLKPHSAIVVRPTATTLADTLRSSLRPQQIPRE